MVSEKRQYVRDSEYLIYGIANGGQCMSYNTLTGYLTYFFVNVFNIDARIVSTMLFLEGIWDTINDPIMGSLVDKTRTRWGKLRPYLLGVPIPLALTTALLFSGPLIVGNYPSTDWHKVLYMCVTYVLWEFFYTIGDVPFWGMSTAMSPNPDDRSKAITSARFISSIVGGLPGLLIPIMIDLVNNGILNVHLRNIFCIYSIITSTIGMGLFSLSGICIKERIVQSEDQPSLKDSFADMIHNRPLRIIILKEILSALGGIGGVFSNYYLIDVLGSASITLLTGIPGTIIGFISYMFVPKMKSVLNNKQIVIATKAVHSGAGILKFLIPFCCKKYTSIKFMIPIMMLESSLTGIFSGVNGVIPTEMIGECVDYSEWTTGKRTEGTSFAVLTFVGKLNGSLSRSIGTFLIPYTGYKTSNTSVTVAQTDRTKRNIFAMNTIIPAILGIFGIIPMLFYDLTGAKRERMFAELSILRSEKIKELEGIDETEQYHATDE